MPCEKNLRPSGAKGLSRLCPFLKERVYPCRRAGRYERQYSNNMGINIHFCRNAIPVLAVVIANTAQSIKAKIR